jgi:YbgC/YbaW family acyl-CoA thioester hydrolase
MESAGSPSIIFRTARRVEFVDTDMAGIAHFSNFFRWMEAAEVDFLLARGLSVTLPWQGTRLALPRVAASCDYVSPAYFEDVVEIALTVKLGRKSITYGTEFSRAGQLLARGRHTCCCCRVLGPRQLESIEIPEEIREKIVKK